MWSKYIMLVFRDSIPNWIKTNCNKITRRYGHAGLCSRDFPDFIIIGAMKSGTSSLYYHLAKHPQLLASYKKEVHFFDGGRNPNIDNFKKGIRWYLAHFPSGKKRAGTKEKTGIKTFEATPMYIFNPLVPKRIFNIMPGVKLILILRNPTERAISHYFHAKRVGRESLPIMDALQAEESRLNPLIYEQNYKNENFIFHSYKRRGIYHEQIRRFLHYFPENQMLIISYEEFLSNTAHVTQQVFEFTGVNTSYKIKDLTRANVFNNKTHVDKRAYQYLDDYFAPHNKELYELTDRNFGW